MHQSGWAIVATTVAFVLSSQIAGWLLVPYPAWVSFAAVLNFTIWRLNTGRNAEDWTTRWFGIGLLLELVPF